MGKSKPVKNFNEQVIDEKLLKADILKLQNFNRQHRIDQEEIRTTILEKRDNDIRKREISTMIMIMINDITTLQKSLSVSQSVSQPKKLERRKKPNTS